MWKGDVEGASENGAHRPRGSPWKEHKTRQTYNARDAFHGRTDAQSSG